jgi:PAZ domain
MMYGEDEVASRFGSWNMQNIQFSTQSNLPYWTYLISVYDYFKKWYNITITERNLPVVNVVNRQNPRYLPAQVCHVLPGQPSRSKLSSGQTQKMIRFAVRKPVENAN